MDGDAAGRRSTARTKGGRRAPAARGRGVYQRVGTGVVWLVVAFNVFLLVWVIASSLKTSREYAVDPWSLPTALRLDSYVRAWNVGNFAQAALNTVLVVSTAAVSVVAISAPAAYVLSRIPGRASSALILFFAIGIGLPNQLVAIPLFFMFHPLGLTNNLLGLYLIYVAVSLPFTVFLLTGFFRSLPSSLEEAAAIDGCGSLMTFRLVMLPLARSGLLTALILNVVGLWSELLFALVFIQSSGKETLSLALLGLLQTFQYTGADWSLLFAGTCIVVLPIALLYVWLGQRIIEGMTLGSFR